MSTAHDTSIDLQSQEFLADPFPTYERLRRDTPVLHTSMAYMAGMDVYFPSRHRDCVDLTPDHRFRRVVEGSEPFPLPEALRFMSTDKRGRADITQCSG